MPVTQPRPPEDTTTPLRDLPMFTWRRCEIHWWLGVSILQAGDSTPVCYTETGVAHPVNAVELGAVA